MNAVSYISPALFIASCCLPCLEIREGSGKMDIMLGLRALVVGWSGIFAGIVAWYANPIWLLGVVMGVWGKPVVAIIAGLATLPIAWTTKRVLGRELPADEGNVNKMTVVRVLPGFYMWLISLAALPVASLIEMFKS